jgi:hypothetical protein
MAAGGENSRRRHPQWQLSAISIVNFSAACIFSAKKAAASSKKHWRRKSGSAPSRHGAQNNGWRNNLAKK